MRKQYIVCKHTYGKESLDELLARRDESVVLDIYDYVEDAIDRVDEEVEDLQKKYQGDKEFSRSKIYAEIFNFTGMFVLQHSDNKSLVTIYNRTIIPGRIFNSSVEEKICDLQIFEKNVSDEENRGRKVRKDFANLYKSVMREIKEEKKEGTQ